MNKKTIVAGATAAALAGSIAFASTASAEPACGPGATRKIECPGAETSNGFDTTSSPAVGTGGLILRDEKGRDLNRRRAAFHDFDESGFCLIYGKARTRRDRCDERGEIHLGLFGNLGHRPNLPENSGLAQCG